MPAAAAPSTSSNYAVTGSVALDPSSEAYGVAVDAGVGKAYVSQLQMGTVAVVDTRKKKVTKQIPVGEYAHGVGVDESRHLVYVTNILSNSVSVIDTRRDIVIATIPVTSLYPNRVAVDATANTIYVSNADGDSPSVTVLDGATRTVKETITLTEGLSGIAVDPGTRTVYGSSPTGLLVIDASTNTVSGTVPVGGQPTSVAVNARTHDIYVTNAGSNSVSVIDGRTRATAAVIPVGGSPQAVSVDASREAVYVAHAGSGVSVISAVTKAVVATVPLQGYATAATTNTKTSAVYVVGYFDFGAGSLSSMATITCSPLKGGARCK